MDSQIRLAAVKGCLDHEVYAVFEDCAGRHVRETDKIGGQICYSLLEGMQPHFSIRFVTEEVMPNVGITAECFPIPPATITVISSGLRAIVIRAS